MAEQPDSSLTGLATHRISGDETQNSIMLTHPCNSDYLKPHFYKVKQEFTGVLVIFLIFALKD